MYCGRIPQSHFFFSRSPPWPSDGLPLPVSGRAFWALSEHAPALCFGEKRVRCWGMSIAFSEWKRGKLSPTPPPWRPLRFLTLIQNCVSPLKPDKLRERNLPLVGDVLTLIQFKRCPFHAHLAVNEDMYHGEFSVVQSVEMPTTTQSKKLPSAPLLGLVATLWTLSDDAIALRASLVASTTRGWIDRSLFLSRPGGEAFQIKERARPRP